MPRFGLTIRSALADPDLRFLSAPKAAMTFLRGQRQSGEYLSRGTQVHPAAASETRQTPGVAGAQSPLTADVLMDRLVSEIGIGANSDASKSQAKAPKPNQDPSLTASNRLIKL
ncbi:hypothetical protein ABIA31_001298 [Catenulispora sp. MAP5-51]|uniref:hypothetical protein n=1 Tax=Catenulispora sp. MAP5-51 TaxID=3156298 RepID=UPI0035169293